MPLPMPASRAKRLCPSGVWLPPDFTYYRETSRKVMALVGELGAAPGGSILGMVYLGVVASRIASFTSMDSLLTFFGAIVAIY